MVATQAVFVFQRRPPGTLGELLQFAEFRQPDERPIQHPRQLGSDYLCGKVRVLLLRTVEAAKKMTDGGDIAVKNSSDFPLAFIIKAQCGHYLKIYCAEDILQRKPYDKA